MMQLSRFPLLAIMALAMFMPVAMPQSALAQDGQVRPAMTYEQCMASGDAGMGMTSGMMECNNIEFIRLDDILNKTYQSIRKTLNLAQKRQLQLLERRWIARRDQQCLAEMIEIGGTLGRLSGSGCMLDETEKRIQWLKSNYVVRHPIAGK
ncbi:lysozyme inhibitor LprI family protein [Aquisediminimonas sediminicola]|uniref:lysozyme inhibitor LprI family protein n=1 Tax=Alteraquisediminimonas sediminicola TaxID=2676787 RepID=UPI001C8E7E12|nr:lysozyme inhibitor LprI family protein [Aquisediminimonas sediminicola]